ncbi:hypothetical protein BCR37DRAFT_376840 [Protomyces lactucae-debilis]|uniref:HTH APSES-type domain-containing protein n=1 Tax=Protomyces lactucae-debilis TaxID=2754530 RepID=A0A1Y2FQK6_PROLT|nr:uncharacterized protein BCR37DRAFT_376840 [Protomyces lactucae-debilis]ORY86281.1 hypothetical protein BCR37DRAFT_376840 [Protomyces lactucae-debilis]
MATTAHPHQAFATPRKQSQAQATGTAPLPGTFLPPAQGSSREATPGELPISSIARTSAPAAVQSSMTGNAATAASAEKPNSDVFKSTYSGVALLEMVCRGVSVMRRVSDSALNATQILKVAGIDKAKRTKILEREILTGPHEKVQGGYGRYQGTWISYAIGLDLCERYGVRARLSPLLDFDMQSANLTATPTKREHHTITGQSSYQTPNGRAGQSRQGSLHIDKKLKTPLHSSPLVSAFPTLQEPLQDIQSTETTIHVPEPKQIPLIDASEPMREEDMTPLPPLSPDTTEQFDRSRDMLTQIFLETDPTRSPDSLLDIGFDIEVDVPIDELGHTALHWASALARLPLVQALLARGADPRRGNAASETALFRAVMVTNNLDQETFRSLLDCLAPSIFMRDGHKRTLLHHIALTSGIKGRSAASLYYLETLLEWIVRDGASICARHGLDLPRFQRQLLDARDRNGDTALNIAARLGNKMIVQVLLDVQADPYVPNHAGLRPVDSGALPVGLATRDASAMSLLPSQDDKAPLIPETVVRQSNVVVEEMTQLLVGLKEEFEQEMHAKDALLVNTQATLRQTQQALASLRQQVEGVKGQQGSLEEMRQRTANYGRALQSPDFAPHQTHEADGVAPVQEACMPDEAYDAIKEKDLLRMQRHVRAYQQNNAALDALGRDSLSRSSELEAKCRRVIALCTNVSVEDVDALLGKLLMAVQSDGPTSEVDLNRLAGFLKTVNEM